MISLSNFLRSLRVKKAEFDLFLMKLPCSHLLISPRHHRVITNQLPITLPSEYAPDLIVRSNIVTLKCSAKDVSIKDIPHAWFSNDFSYDELIELHSFSWISLIDLDMDRQWLRMIRKHISFWISHFKRPNNLAWEAASERVYNWVVRYNLISKTSDSVFIKKFTRSILSQMEYLRRMLYLPLNAVEKFSLIRTLMVAYAAVGNVSAVRNALKELCRYINSNDCINEAKSTYDLVKLLRYLIDIDGMTYVCKHGTPAEAAALIAKLSGTIRKITHSDGGVCLFKSAFSPAPAYIDALLSYAKQIIPNKDSDGYLRFSSLDGSLFLSLRDKQLSTEFTFSGRRIILGSYFCFSGGNFSKWSDVEYSTRDETSNIWFTGKSSFVANDHTVTFSKKLYMNSFGTELRCEESFSTQSFDITRYIILPGDAEITSLEYQNGFFIVFPDGTKWIWNFSENAKFSFDNQHHMIANGKRIQISLLMISVDTSKDKVLHWSIKKNIT